MERLTPQYPYLPPHITEPKEIKKLYMVELPPHSKSGTISTR